MNPITMTVWLSRCALIGSLVALGGCDFRIGNGEIVTQPRTVGGAFTEVRASGNIDVDVSESTEAAVSVTTDKNLQDSFTVSVAGGVLVVDNVHQARPSSGSHVTVTLPRLDRVEVNGPNTVRLHDMAAGTSLAIVTNDVGGLEYTGTIPAIDVSLDGPGSIKLSGTTDSLTIRTDDFGSVDAQQMVATSADIQSSGSGDISTSLGGGTLRLRLYGSGNIDWWGDANVVESLVQGSGSITHH